jgi:molybdate transport system substrate-binding protein
MRAWLFLALLWASNASAAEVLVAVAANFAQPLQAIAAQFTQTTGHQIKVSAGGSGKLYAQIRHGAPFQVLLSADDEIPARLEQEGLAVPGSRFTYATGGLVVWSASLARVDAETLRTGQFKHLAIANPRLAPYGRAAVEALDKLGLTARLKPRWVMGENIAQTHQFVASGNAELGFVAAAQVQSEADKRRVWVVPQALYSPIRQDAVLLLAGRTSPAAQAFMAFMRDAQTQALIRRYGYQ